MTRWRSVALWSVTLWLLCRSTAVHSLAELVNKEAETILGQVSRHSRAIACTNGGDFASVSTSSSDGLHTTGLTICCSEGSTVWWEGLEDEGLQCQPLGVVEGDPTMATCEAPAAVQSIHFDVDIEVNALQEEEWAQFCDAAKCGLMAGALSVGCYNSNNEQSQPVQQAHTDKLDCPAGHVVEVIYAHWDHLSVQSIDAVTCRPVYPAVAVADPIFVSGCATGGGAPTPVNLRCQRTAADVCGCISVPTISDTPYYGCVMSGYDAANAVPLVTLPGVLEAAPQPQCNSPERTKRFLPTRIWERWLNPNKQCLTASSEEAAAWDGCMDGTLLPSQGWRLVTFQVAGIDALESLKFPGYCAVIDEELTLTLCSCSSLALQVKTQAITLLAGTPITPPEPVEVPVETPAIAPVPVAVAPAEEPAVDPEVEDPGAEEPSEGPEADPAYEPEPEEEPDEPEEDPYEPAEDPDEYVVPEDPDEDTVDAVAGEGPAVDVEPVDVEPVVEPVDVEPVDVEPVDEPVDVEPVDVEPVDVEPVDEPVAVEGPNARVRPPRARVLLDVPLGQCPGGEVTSWKLKYESSRVNPYQQFKLHQAATALVDVVMKDNGLATAKFLGAPDSSIESLHASEFDPVRVCNWRYVVCGPTEIVQVGIVGGEGKVLEGIKDVPGMRGLTVVGEGGAQSADDALPPELEETIVALHMQSTALTGRLPCSWGHAGLMYLGLVGNKRMSGPLPLCFAKVQDGNVIIKASDNDAENPFCGSGSQQNHIAKQLPKCSTLDGIATFPETPVQLTLDQDEDCARVAEKFKSFLETKMGFALDVTDMTCSGDSTSNSTSSSRRLLQAAPVTVNADLSGPLANSVLKAGLTEGDAGGLYSALQNDIGVSGVTVNAPDLPADSSIATLAPDVDPNDGGSSGGSNNRSLLTIILIACVAAAVVLFAVVGFLFCRARSRKSRQHQEVGSLKPNNAATYVSVDASITQNSADFSGAVPPADAMKATPPHLPARISLENRNTFGAPVAPAPAMIPVPGMGPYKGPEKQSTWGTHTQAFAASSAFQDTDLHVAAAHPRPNVNTNTPTNGGIVSTMPRPAPASTSPPGGGALLPLAQSFSGEIDESEMFNTGDENMISRSLSKVRTTGNARRVVKEVAPTLPSSANNYPHSEELAKMSSREIHRRMRSPEVSGSRRAKAGDDSESATPGTGGPSSSKHATPTPTSKPKSEEPKSEEPKSEEQVDRPANPVTERPAMGYLAAAVAGTGAAAAGAAAVANPSSNPSPPGSLNNNTPGAGAAAEAARVRDTYASLNSLVPGAQRSSENQVNVETMQEKNGIQLKAARRRVGTAGLSEPASPDDFSMRVGNTFLMGMTGDLSQGDPEDRSRTVKGGGETGEVDGSPDSKGGVSVSSFTSVSVMSESTTVYTDIGNKDTEGDAMTKLEQVLNRVQRELGGQVGSFRLKGIRHRFTGRSSLVAFADGMWGGEFALKFYSDLEAAQTEFAIYRQAEDLHMALPPVQEIEDNTGGVLRLKDGTPLPPYLAMPRGLPLPDWYAMHRPRQVATLAMLSQLLYRLEKLHVSGYCHNDIKPANMVLLDGGNKKQPEWHIVDFTNMSQIGSNTRARYTLEYAAPEVIRAVGAMRAHYVTCQPSMDVWSMGVICFEVLTSKPFFPMDYNREAMKDGLIGLEPLPVEEEPALFSKIPAEGKLRATVKMMLSRDTEKRPTAAMVGKAVGECLKELTGEAPEPLDASPVSSLQRDESTAGI